MCQRVSCFSKKLRERLRDVVSAMRPSIFEQRGATLYDNFLGTEGGVSVLCFWLGGGFAGRTFERAVKSGVKPVIADSLRLI